MLDLFVSLVVIEKFPITAVATPEIKFPMLTLEIHFTIDRNKYPLCLSGINAHDL